MRKFSPTEQKVIKYIVSREKVEQMCFSTLFIEFMPTIAIEQTEDGLLRMYNKKSDGKAVDLVDQNLKQLLDILFLIKYLDDNALVGVFHLKGGEEKILHSNKYQKMGDDFFMGRDDGGCGLIGTNHCDYYAELAGLLFQYSHSCYHASETLRELVKNNFKDEETIRFEKSMASARQAICISLVIGLLSIIIGTTGIWLSWKSLNQPLSFPTEKLEEIKTELQHISTTKKEQTPIIINSIPKKDTVPTVSIPKRHK